MPVSLIQCAPVISPHPLKRKTPAKLECSNQSRRGRIVVTPVLNPASGCTDCVCTSTLGTSVMELSRPGAHLPRYSLGSTSRIRPRPAGGCCVMVRVSICRGACSRGQPGDGFILYTVPYNWVDAFGMTAGMCSELPVRSSYRKLPAWPVLSEGPCFFHKLRRFCAFPLKPASISESFPSPVPRMWGRQRGVGGDPASPANVSQLRPIH